jgi:hypothetical protein
VIVNYEQLQSRLHGLQLFFGSRPLEFQR